MTETAHLLVGAALASRVSNPILASSLALISHVMLDMVPHWDTGTNWRARPWFKTAMYTGVDLAIGIILSLFLFQNKAPIPYMLFVMFMSTLPDWLEAPYFIPRFRLKPFALVYRLQHFIHKKQQLPWGLISQIVIISLFVSAILFTPSLTALAK